MEFWHNVYANIMLHYPAGLRLEMQRGQSAGNEDEALEGISENKESASAESLHSETSASE